MRQFRTCLSRLGRDGSRVEGVSVSEVEGGSHRVPRFLPHYRRLKDAAESVELIYERMAGLGEKRGPALFQLPPQLKRDDERLAAFLPLLAGRGRAVFEFRVPGWYAPEVLDLLRAHDVALCVSDHAAAPAPWAVTASFAYVRGHGPSGRYHGAYEGAQLERWAAFARVCGGRVGGVQRLRRRHPGRRARRRAAAKSVARRLRRQFPSGTLLLICQRHDRPA